MTSSLDHVPGPQTAYDGIAEAYDSRFACYSARFAADLIDLMFPQKSESALDIAGGTGPAGLKLAERVGKEGAVTIVDTSAAMLDIAKRKARASKLANIRTVVMNAEHLDFPDSSFDLVTCAFGIMFFTNVASAISEAKRVLKPGGRIGFTVWSVPERIPFIAEPLMLILRHMAPLPVRLIVRIPVLGANLGRQFMVSRLPAEHSPARFSKKGSLEGMLAAAGFTQIRRELRAFSMEFNSFDEYWESLAGATPLGELIEEHPRQFERIREELLLKFSPSIRNGRLMLFNEAGLVLAAKPEEESSGQKSGEKSTPS